MKTYKRISLGSILICALFVFGTTGCKGVQKGYIRVKGIEKNLMFVMDRHDVYVNNDPKLNIVGDKPGAAAAKVKKDTYLGSTKTLRKLIKEAKK